MAAEGLVEIAHWQTSWTFRSAVGPFLLTLLALLLAFTNIGAAVDTFFVLSLTLYAIGGCVVSLWKRGRQGVSWFLLGSLGGFIVGFGVWLLFAVIVSIVG